MVTHICIFQETGKVKTGNYVEITTNQSIAPLLDDDRVPGIVRGDVLCITGVVFSSPFEESKLRDIIKIYRTD